MINLFGREPWLCRESIYSYVCRQIDSKGIYSGDMTLPDEKLFITNNSIRFAPGAMDGIFGHHAVGGEGDVKAVDLLDLISKKDSRKAKVEFYTLVKKNDISASNVDSIIEQASERGVKVTNNLIKWLEILAFKSPDRGAVKIGIALLGAAGVKNVLSNLISLGKHEEFTLYVCVAIIRLSDNAEHDLWSLAKSVNGWGRIHLVERLADTNDADIKSWIFLEGYRNSVMNEYLALIAAETGEMSRVLGEDKVTDDQLKASSNIITALISEGPVAGVSAYKDAAIAFDAFMKHVLLHEKSIDYLVATLDIYDYLSDEERDWSELTSCGWDNENVKTIRERAKFIVENESWRVYIKENEATNDNSEFWKLKHAAKRLNVDYRDIHWKRLMNKSNDSGCWFNVMESADDSTIDTIIDFALKTIPFKEKCTGPDIVSGLGDDYQIYSIIDFVLQVLRRFPGKGEAIILYAMDSPVIRNRNGFLNVLNEWGYERLSKNILNKLSKLARIEPDEEIKERVNDILTQVNL